MKYRLNKAQYGPRLTAAGPRGHLSQLFMTTVTEGLPRRPSQIKPFVAAFIPVLSMKGMAGDAYDPSPFVEDHVGGDAHGRDNIHRMRPNGIDAMML
jgi:hypothetical protein